MKKVFSLDVLAKSKDKSEIIAELFNISVDKYSSVLFQRFDHDWGEFIDVEIVDLKHKDKVKVAIIRKEPNIKDNNDYGQVIVLL